MEIHALRGTEDLIPPATDRWVALETRVAEVCMRYGYRPIRTPVLEPAGLFTRAVGDATDIVQKEMYVWEDRGGRAIALRPEATASIARAYVEHGVGRGEGFVKWFYIGPMFRAERPQAGRRRQFHQVGVEAIGSSHPLIDAEIITLFADVLDAAGVVGYRVRLNTLGCREDRAPSRDRLRSWLEPLAGRLCAECRERLQRNVFRIVDCKQDACRRLVREAVPAGARVFAACEACCARYAAVRSALEVAGVAAEDDPFIARGLDYYTGTVFEVTHEALGAKDAVGAGGRYDDLIADLGGSPTPATGFAVGLERVLMIAGAVVTAAAPAPLAVFVAALGEGAQRQAFRLVHELRRAGVSADMDFGGRSLKAQLRVANRAGSRLVAILGEQELQQQVVTVKDMQSGAQDVVPMDGLVRRAAAMGG